MVNVLKVIPTFTWEELNGKTLKIIHNKIEDAEAVIGQDTETGKCYMLHSHVKVD